MSIEDNKHKDEFQRKNKLQFHQSPNQSVKEQHGIKTDHLNY